MQQACQGRAWTLKRYGQEGCTRSGRRPRLQLHELELSWQEAYARHAVRPNWMDCEFARFVRESALAENGSDQPRVVVLARLRQMDPIVIEAVSFATRYEHLPVDDRDVRV